jgi:hypothetical protein
MSDRFGMVNWPNSVFLVGTLILTLTAVPAFIWYHGVDRFQVLLFGRSLSRQV